MESSDLISMIINVCFIVSLLLIMIILCSASIQTFGNENFNDTKNVCQNQSIVKRWDPKLPGIFRIPPFETVLQVTGANIIDYQHSSPPEGYGSLNPNLDKKIQPRPDGFIFNLDTKVIENGEDTKNQ